MSIEKTINVDQVEVTDNGCVQVRTATVITEDGQMIDKSFRRHVIAPGNDYSGEAEHVQAICAATHTADVIAAYKAATAAQGV
jgi:hypothetical protein